MSSSPLLLALVALLACNGKDETADTGSPADDGDADTDTDTDADADADSDADSDADADAQTLYVTTPISVVAYDLTTGARLPKELADLDAPSEAIALDDGTVMMHLGNTSEVLAVDGETIAEVARFPSSAIGGTRPVHAYLSPTFAGQRYWFVLNDGLSTDPATSAVELVEIDPTSPDFLSPRGDFAAGVGHHKAAFSDTQQRAVVSSLSDCANVVQVVDYSDAAAVTVIATMTAADAGMDGSSWALTCDPTYVSGQPPSPGGCTTASHTGRIYCGIGATGQIAVIDVDAPSPSWSFVQASGSGGGAVTHSADGRYVYMLQDKPREGDTTLPGELCQLGQLVTLDTDSETVVSTIPLKYDGPSCARPLVGTDEESSEGNRMIVNPDGSMLYMQLAGGFGVADARIRREVVVDLSDPAAPVQLDSVETGTSTGFHGDTVSGDGAWLFVANNLDASVTQIDARTLEVVATIPVAEGAQSVATWGEVAGPSYQPGVIH